MIKAGLWNEGLSHLAEAVKIKPDWGPGHNSLANVYCASGRYAEAWQQVRLARKYGYEPPRSLIKLLTQNSREQHG